MDRAQRRQRRLDQKNWQGERGGRGRGRPKLQVSEASNCDSCKACGLKWGNQGRTGSVQNVSEEESTDDITVYEKGINLSTKDLQAQLYVSDAKALKWQKIAAQRSEENKELQTEIECLKMKIKEITEANADRCGQMELKLRAEIQNLKEKNQKLIEKADSVLKHYSSYSSAMEVLEQAVQDAKNTKQNSYHQPSKGLGNAGRNVHESIAEVNACVGDLNTGHRQSSKRTGNSERNGYESAVNAEVNVDMEQQTTRDYPKGQTRRLGGHGSGIAQQQVHADGSPNKCPLQTHKSSFSERDGEASKADLTLDIEGQSSERAASGKGDAPVGPDEVASIGNPRPSGVPSEDVSEVLFTAAEKKSALALVSQEFLMWLNSRTRRPTAKEMSIHKSQLAQTSWPPGKEVCHWTGISGTLLLDKFQADTEFEKPNCNALSTLLRSVLRIEGSKWTDDTVWCLVWTDCISPDKLPGYRSHPQDTKRARAVDHRFPTRSVKVKHP